MPRIKLKQRQRIFLNELTLPCSALLQKLYIDRGITSVSELDLSTKTLLSASSLKGISEACSLLYQALLSAKKIVIVGDFDADGATSTALSLLCLRELGFMNVDYLIPNRFDYGYGLTPESVDLAIAKGAQLLITVDNGISSIKGVAYAKEKGLQVLITDHHLPAEVLPNADVIVDPNQKDCLFPSKNLAGVGVAFYIMSALRSYMIQKDHFSDKGIRPPTLTKFLDIVALGTVADVVILDANNRTLVEQGLMRIRAGACRLGISALIKVAKRAQHSLVASDLGFSLGPRLNAAGRLDEMRHGVELLLCEDAVQADLLAQELDALNHTRREIEQGMQEEALQALENLALDEKNMPYAICLFDESWHQGVIGLVASRIKERYYRPTFVFAKANDTEIKASARSIAGIHIRDILDLLDKKMPGMILKFGGHAMAAGLSIKATDFERFKQGLNEVLASQVDADILQNVLLSDGPLQGKDLTLEQAYELRNAGPWGQGFPAPLFDAYFKIIEQRLVGEKHLKMVLECEGTVVDAIAFNVDLDIWPDPRIRQVFCAYRLDVNEFRGASNVQLLIELLEVR
ncbi:single-stranded-DNA-specific exonuclease RecJ [Psychromonas sp. CNPT3]|uniref:single-stranded-DNA-specific exonuclease RecJ n=1 Tax=Psychromonas sp. CNPT3 TaxID=314282 RepID=UPI00006E587E|nr:single-stranded-DNA-specific exonuclease RecJ [Psychromonas sp. CNPT3]AGH80404.1 single-stranded-DNA-specific exonuclease RecJ [Psychromonas sp. CNPT3]